jgi:hypothetical protein
LAVQPVRVDPAGQALVIGLPARIFFLQRIIPGAVHDTMIGLSDPRVATDTAP